MEYYTPDIEDIRVGYECEYKAANGEFRKYIIDFSEMPFEGDTIKEYFTEELKRIRTPYLTKEQIEAEGWKPRGLLIGEFDMDLSKAIVNFEKFIENGYYNMYFDPEMRQMNISIWTSDNGSSTLYKGNCPSVNELRYISKLLNITK